MCGCADVQMTKEVVWHFSPFREPKPAKTAIFSAFFWVKIAFFYVFLYKNEAKSAFFEPFLGVKSGVFWHFGCLKLRQSV